MKPDLYSEYHKFYDLFSSPRLFPSLLTFCEKIVERAPSNTRRIADIGAGTGLFTRILQQKFNQAVFTVVEPSEYMMPIAKARLDAPRTDFYQSSFDQCTDIPPQDVIVFQRSLYAFSGDLKYYQKLAKQVSRLLGRGGLLAIYEISKPYDIKQLHDFFQSNRAELSLTENEFDRLWAEFEKILIAFNQGVKHGQYTLFNRDKLEAVFGKLFALTDTDNANIFLFRRAA